MTNSVDHDRSQSSTSMIHIESCYGSAWDLANKNNTRWKILMQPFLGVIWDAMSLTQFAPTETHHEGILLYYQFIYGMVLGYDPDRISRSTYLHHLASGTLGGIVTRATLSPFDVVKIRFQLQTETGQARIYTGLVQATRHIYNAEGVKAFWKGHIPAQVLSMVYGGVQFSSFEFYTASVHQIFPHSKSETVKHTLTHGVCGSLAAVTATLAGQPFDVLRTRFAAQAGPKLFTSSSQAMVHMVKTEGFFSLYRGLVPTLTQIVPFATLQFGSRSVFEAIWLSHGFNEGKVAELVCGGGAGLFAKTMVYPLDVVKKRLQIQGFQAPTASQIRSYTGFIHCCKTMWRHEGTIAFFKGYQAAALKSAVTSGLIFAMYRFFRELLEPQDSH